MDENEAGEDGRGEELMSSRDQEHGYQKSRMEVRWLKPGTEPRGDSRDLFAEVNKSWMMERQTRKQ